MKAFHDVMRDRASINNLGMHKQMPWLAYTRDGGVQVRDGLTLTKGPISTNGVVVPS